MRALRSYTLLIRWQALRLRNMLPLAFVVQSLFAFGIVVGYPLLFPEIDRLTILFLATGRRPSRSSPWASWRCRSCFGSSTIESSRSA